MHLLLEALLEMDRQVFHYINTVLHANWLDGFMILMRNQNTWIPLYIFILYRVYKMNPAAAIPFLVLSGITFALTDYTSASIIKPMVARLRPCYDADIAAGMYQLVGCGGKYSFPSSHAANHFGLACVWFHMIYFIKRTKWQWLWFWAAVICYAQIYVGKHFPLDIIAGAILGCSIGYLVSRFFIYWHNKTNGTFKPAAIHHRSVQPKTV